MERIGGRAKCGPPFRTTADRDALREMPMVVSDHSPSTLGLKQGDDFAKLWGGISGCQSTRQLLLASAMEPPRVAAVTATSVAARFRLDPKGDIAPGFDAALWLAACSQGDVGRRDDLLYPNPFTAHEDQAIRSATVRTLV